MRVARDRVRLAAVPVFATRQREIAVHDTLASATFTTDQLEWAKLAFDHVRVGDFEGAIDLIQGQRSRELLAYLARHLRADARTSAMDVSEVTDEIARQSQRTLLH